MGLNFQKLPGKINRVKYSFPPGILAEFHITEFVGGDLFPADLVGNDPDLRKKLIVILSPDKSGRRIPIDVIRGSFTAFRMT